MVKFQDDPSVAPAGTSMSHRSRWNEGPAPADAATLARRSPKDPRQKLDMLKMGQPTRKEPLKDARLESRRLKRGLAVYCYAVLVECFLHYTTEIEDKLTQFTREASPQELVPSLAAPFQRSLQRKSGIVTSIYFSA